MEKEIRMPYKEFLEMKDTIRKQNQTINTAIMHEGNMIIDNRMITTHSGQKVIPDISGKIPAVFDLYKSDFDKKAKLLRESYKICRDHDLELDRKERELDAELERRDDYKALSIVLFAFWLATVAAHYYFK